MLHQSGRNRKIKLFNRTPPGKNDAGIRPDFSALAALCETGMPCQVEISKAREHASQMSSDPRFSSEFRLVTSAIADALDKAQSLPDKIDRDYLGVLRDLLKACPAAGIDDPAVFENANALVSSLKLLHDLTAGKINPTQVKYAKTKMLGEYLVELGFGTHEHITQALQEQKDGVYPGLRMGDILQKKGVITRAQLDQAIELQMLDNL
jgi:hypothetical protein